MEDAEDGDCGDGISSNRLNTADRTMEMALESSKFENQASGLTMQSSLQDRYNLGILESSSLASRLVPQKIPSNNLDVVRSLEGTPLTHQVKESGIKFEPSLGRGSRRHAVEFKPVHSHQQVTHQGVPRLIAPVAEKLPGFRIFPSSSNPHISDQGDYFMSGLAGSSFENCLAGNWSGIDSVISGMNSSISKVPLHGTENISHTMEHKYPQSSIDDIEIKSAIAGLKNCSVMEKIAPGVEINPAAVEKMLPVEACLSPNIGELFNIPYIEQNPSSVALLQTNPMANDMGTLSGVKNPPRVENPSLVVKNSGNSTDVSVQQRSATPCVTTVTTPLLVTRPSHIISKKGFTGLHIPLVSNYFKLCSAKDWVVYQYHVEFNPQKEDVNLRKKILKVHKGTLGHFIYDGNLLYSSQNFSTNPLTLASATSKERVDITIHLQGILNPQDTNYMRLFNSLVRKCLSALKLQLIGVNYYDPKAKSSLSVDRTNSWELWPGFMISIRQHEQDVLLCAEITHKLIRSDTALNLLNSTNSRNSAKNAVRGLEVLTPYNNRVYYISDIDFDSTPQTTFTLANGSSVTFASYYKDKYETRVKNDKQPMLISKFKSRRDESIQNVYLVPELCKIVGLSQDWMKYDMFLFRAIAERTNFSPGVHIQKIKDFISRIIKETATIEVLKGWNMELKADMVQFEGRVLPLEKILLGAESKNKGSVDFDWNPDLYTGTFLNPVILESWFVLVPTDMHGEVKHFISNLQKIARDMGMKIVEPRMIGLLDDSVASLTKQLDKLLLKDKPQLVCCILRNKGDTCYNAIKRKCCLDHAVATQVILKKSIEDHKDVPISRRLVMQINCKIGGSPWGVVIPLAGLMTVGIDLCKDAKNKAVSYCAVVASINDAYSRFFSAAAPYRSNEDRSHVLAGLFSQAIQKFSQRNNNQLPSRIVVYRDGVGKREIPFIYEHEVKQFQDAILKLYGKQQWHFAYVLVSTRANTRIFTSNGFNPPTGTVVDDCITRPDRYDFFLVTTPVFQRTQTSYPTMYNVLFDNTGLQPDKMQRLTYKLSHLYYNLKGIIRTPAPVRYAQRLVQLVALHLHRAPHPDLSELLYFL